MEEWPKMLSSFIFLLTVGGSIFLKQPINKYIGAPFCTYAANIHLFGIVHWFNGGLGTALLRWLFIKHSTKIHIEEMNIAVLISMTSLALSVVHGYNSSTVYHYHHNDRGAGICLSRPKEYHRILNDYFGNASDDQIPWIVEALFFPPAPHILATLAQFGLYASICLHLRVNDSAVAPYLNKETMKKRKRRNIITLAGSIQCFATKLLWMLLIRIFLFLHGIDISMDTSRIVLLIRGLIISLYGGLSLLGIATSPQLSSDFICFWRKVKKYISSILNLEESGHPKVQDSVFSEGGTTKKSAHTLEMPQIITRSQVGISTSTRDSRASEVTGGGRPNLQITADVHLFELPLQLPNVPQK